MKPLLSIFLLACAFEVVLSEETKAEEHDGKNQALLKMEPPK